MTDSVQFQWGFNTDLLQFLSGFSVYSVGVLYSVDAATVRIHYKYQLVSAHVFPVVSCHRLDGLFGPSSQ